MKKFIFLFVAIVGIYVSGCKCKGTDCPCDGDNCEEELITSVVLTFKDSASTDSLVYAFRDPDGDGANAATEHDTIRLAADKTYLVSAKILNESVSPADNITEEIYEERNDHQFFYLFTNVNVNFTYKDDDTNTPPLPVGINTQWKTGAASNGNVQMILKHQPSVKDNKQTTGDTDVEVVFQTVIQ